MARFSEKRGALVPDPAPEVHGEIWRCPGCGRHKSSRWAPCPCRQSAPALGCTTRPDPQRTLLGPDSRSRHPVTAKKLDSICPECGTPYRSLRKRRCYACHPGRQRTENYRPRKSPRPPRAVARASGVVAAFGPLPPAVNRPEVQALAARIERITRSVADLLRDLTDKQARAVMDAAYRQSRGT
jgi:hypothetical protein